MENGGSVGAGKEGGSSTELSSNIGTDIEKQSVEQKPSELCKGVVSSDQLTITIVVSDCVAPAQPVGVLSDVDLESPRKPQLSRTSSYQEQCRVCQQEKEEDLIVLGCQCRGGLGNAHRSCIDTWFSTRGSNKCEICQHVAVNVAAPEPHASTYWIWRMDPASSVAVAAQERQRGCFSPLWVAFSILIAGLLLDVVISLTLGVSALPVNVIIGVIVVLGLGTALRLALEFCHEWSVRRVVHRAEANVGLGYHPAL